MYLLESPLAVLTMILSIKWMNITMNSDCPIQNQLTSAIRKVALKKGMHSGHIYGAVKVPCLAQNVSATLLIQRIINESKALLNS